VKDSSVCMSDSDSLIQYIRRVLHVITACHVWCLLLWYDALSIVLYCSSVIYSQWIKLHFYIFSCLFSPVWASEAVFVRIDPVHFLAGCRKMRLNLGWLFLGFLVFMLVVVGLFCQCHSQVIGWKDSSPKWPVMCLHTHSVSFDLWREVHSRLRVQTQLENWGD